MLFFYQRVPAAPEESLQQANWELSAHCPVFYIMSKVTEEIKVEVIRKIVSHICVKFQYLQHPREGVLEFTSISHEESLPLESLEPDSWQVLQITFRSSLGRHREQLACVHHLHDTRGFIDLCHVPSHHTFSRLEESQDSQSFLT